ncbi:MAG TPA: hypothetical protein ACFYD2_10440, partial [Candidatus Avalokitesvara rifleensis]|uniref:hypothetical protein n=1 Tax=Candidatus Avalokitesvara rifleensis TaxID=3367620 RepID=UPI004024A8D3
MSSRAAEGGEESRLKQEIASLAMTGSAGAAFGDLCKSYPVVDYRGKGSWQDVTSRQLPLEVGLPTTPPRAQTPFNEHLTLLVQGPHRMGETLRPFSGSLHTDRVS